MLRLSIGDTCLLLAAKFHRHVYFQIGLNYMTQVAPFSSVGAVVEEESFRLQPSNRPRIALAV